VQFPQGLIHHPTEHLWKPEVEAGKTAKYDDAQKGVVEVGDDEVGAVNLDVGRSRAVHDAGESSENEHSDKAQGPEHRGRKADRALP